MGANLPPRAPRLHDSLMSLDRRIIFLVLAASVAVPLIFPLHLPVKVSQQARAYYEAMEALHPRDAVIFSFDYEPDTMAELDPMSLATLKHAFRNDLRVIVLTNYAGGVGIVERVLGEAASQYGKSYGTDYVFLGYNPDYSATILRMGESIQATFPTDQYRTPTSEIPLLREINSYAKVPLLISVSASALTEYWIIWAGGKFDQKVIAGNTAIQAVLIYPYYQTGQLSGFLGGLKGAAEYENLLEMEGAGLRGMDAQSMAHLIIVAFVILGNVGFFIQKQWEREGRGRGGSA